MSDHLSVEQLEDLAYGFTEASSHLETCGSCSDRHDRLLREKSAFERVLAPRPVEVPRGRALSLVAGGLVLAVAVTLLARLHLAGPAPATQEFDDAMRQRISRTAVDLDADDPSVREKAQKDLRELVRGEPHATHLRQTVKALGPEAAERAAKVAATWRYGRIVFEKTGRIWSANPDGSDVVALTDEQSSPALHPVSSPDGARIAFQTSVRKEIGAEFEYVLQVVNRDGTGLRKIATTVGFLDAAWSPNGRQLAFAGPAGMPDLQLADMDGAETRTLLTGLSMVSTIAWSPDGTRIAVVDSSRHGFGSGRADLRVVDLRNNQVSTLSSEASRGARASWSPDGGSVAYSTPTELRVVNGDGTGSRVLVRGSGNSPAWSPDGRRLAFLRGEGPSLYLMDVDRPGEPRLVSQVVWTYSWAQDSRLILASSNFNTTVIDLSAEKAAEVLMVVGGGKNAGWGPPRAGR